eukprot:PITA_09319
MFSGTYKEPVEHGLLYTRGNDIRLSGFTDADWARSSVDRKSTTTYCFNIGSGMTSWCSRKQKSVVLSSAEAEYMVTSTASCEAIWLSCRERWRRVRFRRETKRKQGNSYQTRTRFLVSCNLAIWLRRLLVNLYSRRMDATKIMCDNQSCIKLSENPVLHDQLKHIDIKCHFVRDCVQRGAVQLSYTPIEEHVADILTKALGGTKLIYFREKMGMVKNPFQ